MIRLLLLAWLFLPLQVSAHAGVLKSAGDVEIMLKQSPLSPLVGENVQMTFIFFKRDSNEQFRNADVTLRLIDTYYGDESKDEVVLMKEEKTDVNGVITFEYRFPKENYYDVEFSFADQSGAKQEVGFLIQPRARLPVPYERMKGIAIGIGAAVLAMILWGIGKRAYGATLMVFVAGMLGMGAQTAFAHGGSEVTLENTIGTYIAELSYDEPEIRAGELLAFHSSLIDGAGTNEWDFVPYTEVHFAIRQGKEQLYEKVFYNDALGFGGYEFPRKGEYQLFVRFMDGEKLVAETVFPLIVKEGVAAPRTGGFKWMILLYTAAGGAAIFFWLRYRSLHSPHSA